MISPYLSGLFWQARSLFAIIVITAIGIQGCVTRGTLSAPTGSQWERYVEEREGMQSQGAPARCLALSGGGMRSAFYAIGVMKAFSSKRSLDTFDIISSVSGGSYASAWYYQHMFNSRNEPTTSQFLFEDESPFQSLLLRSALQSGDIYFDFEDVVLNYPLALVAGPYMSAIMNVQNLLRDNNVGRDSKPGHLPLPLISQLYSRRLVRMLANAPDGISGQSPKLLDLAKFVRDRKLPMFIVNATIQGSNFEKDFRNKHLFEFTPFHIGSDGFGYWQIIDVMKDRNFSFLMT